MGVMSRLWDARGGFGFPERAGILAGSTVVGRSFSRGLMPRGTADQAVITGGSSALNYGLTAASQSLIEAVAVKVAGRVQDPGQARMSQRGIVLVGDVAAMGLGVLAQRALAHRKDEPIVRAWGRTFGWRVAVGGMAGSILVGSDLLFDSVVRGRGGWGQRAAPVALPLGAVLAAWQYHRLHRGMVQAGVTHDAVGVALETRPTVAVGKSVAVGAGVSAGLLLAATGERHFAGGVAALVTAASPRAELLGRPLGHLAALGVLGALGYQGLRVAFRRAETAGDTVEAAYDPPTSEHVSGGPRSEVSWDTIGREGRRFVSMAMTVEEIEAVMGGSAMPPIRVFVGLETRATTSQRADLAMRELDSLGAFQRSHIVFMSPTGTGYLNYVTAESLELLTRGDVALVAMQYSLRPSPMSLGRVGIGIDQNSAFLHALKWRLAAIPQDRRPRLHIFGESLGAQTSEDVFVDEGVAGLHRAGIDRGLFLGTPAATRFRQKWLSDPAAMDPDGEIVEVNDVQEYLALPEQVRARARYVLLTQHNDPMPKFWFPLAVQAPDWMGPAETREPGVPPETAWRPYITFLITLVDVKNAMHVVPGTFVATGHDYRASLPRFTSLAYDLPVDEQILAEMERVLAQRELRWAERRLIAQEYADAKAHITERLRDWGVPIAPAPDPDIAPAPDPDAG